MYLGERNSIISGKRVSLIRINVSFLALGPKGPPYTYRTYVSDKKNN